MFRDWIVGCGGDSRGFRVLFIAFMIGTIWLPYVQADLTRGMLMGLALAMVLLAFVMRALLIVLVGAMEIAYASWLHDSVHPFPLGVAGACFFSLVWIVMYFYFDPATWKSLRERVGLGGGLHVQ